MTTPLETAQLVGSNVHVRFQGIAALQSANITLNQGDVVGLIGPNGAGKTTLLNVLSGFQRPSSGSVRLGALDLMGIDPTTVRRHGIARTFQAGRLFSGLSVYENLSAAGVALGLRGHSLSSEVSQLLEWIGLDDLGSKSASTLAYSDQRRVGIARALMGRPRFVLLDEPAAGMSQPECSELAHLVREIPRRFGAGVLLVEHNVRLVVDTCENVQVLSGGRSIAYGAAADVLSDRSVIEAYLGGSIQR